MATPLTAIRTIIRDVLRDDGVDIGPGTAFDAIEGWDPMDLVTLVVEVECRFDLTFELPEIDRLSTVGDLLYMIAAKQALVAA